MKRYYNLDFSAKVRWRMRFQKKPAFVEFQDKYKVRFYAESKSVATPELLYVTDDADSIPFDQLPANYFLKANHGWSWNILCYDSQLYLFRDGQALINDDGSLINTEKMYESKITRAQAVQYCRRWLKKSYTTREWAYQHIVPKILVEEILLNDERSLPNDYRFYTFNGTVRAINVGSPLYRRNNENAFFTPQWKLIEFSKYTEKLPNPLPKAPEKLQEMIVLAERLGAGTDFVRVDLYEHLGEILLGEMTIYPMSGSPMSPSGCPKFNLWLGDQWQLGVIDYCIASYWNFRYQLKRCIYARKNG